MTGYTRTALLVPFILLQMCSAASAQDDIPALDLEEYQIVGRDTRIFQITGDKIPTIANVGMALPLPEEERANESSQAIIPDDARLWRLESFAIERRPYTRAELFAGSKTAADIRGRGSLDFGSSGATIDIVSRGAEQNTSMNLPPTSQEIMGIAYRDLAGARLMGSFSFRRDREDLLTDPFRGMDRAADIYGLQASIRTRFMKSWDSALTASVSSGAFSDNLRGDDNDELVVRGGMTAAGNLYGLQATITGDADYVSLDDDTGSKLSAGITGAWLPWSRFGVRFGANAFLSAMPGDDAVLRIYPEAGIDWRIARPLYVTLYFRPSVVTHSYTDSYARNALSLPSKVLYENRTIDAGGEIGVDLSERLRVTIAGFATRSEHRPVFTSSTGYFPVLRDEDIDITGIRAGFDYNPQGTWGISGEFQHRDVSWDRTGDVPYEPADLAIARGHYVPADKWRVYGAAHYYGEHAVALGSTDTVDSFVTVDIGAERELWGYLSVYTEVKNLTNADGAWWTAEYDIPGTGFYAGLRVRY